MYTKTVSLQHFPKQSFSPGHCKKLHSRLRQNPNIQQSPPRIKPILQHTHAARGVHRSLRPDRREPKAGPAARPAGNGARPDHPGGARHETEDPRGDPEKLRGHGGRENETADLDAPPEGRREGRRDGAQKGDHKRRERGAGRQNPVRAEDYGKRVVAANRADRGRDARRSAKKSYGRRVLQAQTAGRGQ